MKHPASFMSPEEIRAWRLWQYRVGVTMGHWVLILFVSTFVLTVSVWIILGILHQLQPGAFWGSFLENFERGMLLPFMFVGIGVAVGQLLERQVGLLKRWEDRWEAHPPWFYQLLKEKARRRLIPWLSVTMFGMGVVVIASELGWTVIMPIGLCAITGLSGGLGFDTFNRVGIAERDSIDPPTESLWVRYTMPLFAPLGVRLFFPWVAVGGWGGVMLVIFTFKQDPAYFWYGMQGIPVGLLLAWLLTWKRKPFVDQLRWQRMVRDVGRVLAGIALMLMVPLWGGGPEMEAVAAGLAGFLVGYIVEGERDARV